MFADQIAEEYPHVRNLLWDTRKVRVHSDIAETVAQMVFEQRGPHAHESPKIKELSKFTCWPDFDTWLEWEEEVPEGKLKYGFLFLGDRGKSVIVGRGLFFLQSKGVLVDGEQKPPMIVPVRFDMENYVLCAEDHYWTAEQRAGALSIDHPLRNWWETRKPLPGLDRDPIAFAAKHANLLSLIKPILFGMLAFMNSPKLIKKREVDVDRLNARRIKRGKYPYHPHHEVRLNIDKHDLKITQGQGDGPERCLHFVRAHLRFLVHPRYKNVSVVLVPPHYRGNPELGIMNTSYAVDRKNSKWKN